MFSHGNIFPLSVVLRTIAHLQESIRHVGVDIVAADLYPAPRRRFLGNDNFHGRGFAGAVVA